MDGKGPLHSYIWALLRPLLAAAGDILEHMDPAPKLGLGDRDLRRVEIAPRHPKVLPPIGREPDMQSNWRQ